MSYAYEQYKKWLEDTRFDEATRQELEAIADDTAEIEDRFYQDLQFGTAGLRGIMAAGTNRMNTYTVARAALGFARTLINKEGLNIKQRGIAISFDARNRSEEFAKLTAAIFVGEGVPVYIFTELHPVPMLSFAIRHTGAGGGVMLTASHNHRKYNGFKAYGEDGSQLPQDDAAVAASTMATLTDLPEVVASVMTVAEAEKSPLWHYLGEELDDAYMKMLREISPDEETVKRQANLSIVYTPLHGAGNKPVRRILREVGFTNVTVVPEQELPDGNFPTCHYPNPEDPKTWGLAMELAKKIDADLLLATDPDSDRTGVCVRTKDGEFYVLSGNEIGLLLMDYVLSAKERHNNLPSNSFCITTVVSSKIPRLIAKRFGVKLYETLTGFKFIGELIKLHDEQGDGLFQFGYEESFGYLAGRDVRDKDAVVSCMLMAEMAAVAADNGETLADRLLALKKNYGEYAEYSFSIVHEGKTGLERIAKAMELLRAKLETDFADLGVKTVKDYLTHTSYNRETGEQGVLTLAKSNVLLYECDGLDWFCVRPSGTEPKIKLYFGCYGGTDASCRQRLDVAMARVKSHLEELLAE